MAASDFGIKVSQPGFDVKTAGDANLYFSSSWPIPKIQDTQRLILNGVATTVDHNLSYPPLAWAWTPQDGLVPCTVNNTQVSIPTLTGLIVRYFIFRLPLNVPYQSPIINSPLQEPQGTEHNVGLKFAKSGKSVDSTDLRDFTLHSGGRSPLLHAVITGALGPISAGGVTINKGLLWSRDLPYRPVFYGYYSADNITFTPLSTISQVPPLVSTGSYGIVVNSLLGGYGSIIVLKDPMDSTNSTSLTL